MKSSQTAKLITGAISVIAMSAFIPMTAHADGKKSKHDEISEFKKRSPQGIDRDRNSDRTDAKRKRWKKNRDIFVRSYDGSGNNLAEPEWGAAFVHLERLAPADYADGIFTLAGENRPSARLISNQVVNQDPDESLPNPFGTTDFVWQWGQFLDHDLDLTDGTEEPAPIPVPFGDPFFDPFGTGTAVIPFNRATFDPESGTDTDNPREQENDITAWIDASNVYGSSEDRVAALRVGPDSPFLKTSDSNLLPFNVDGLSNANGPVQDPAALFVAGDIRVNEQVGLAVMHTLFVREHNRVAAIIQQSRPWASADDVFESARRVVIAEMQMITYNEFLPALLGRRAIPKYRGYKPSTNPNILNEFSVAAYRFGHSLINNQLLRLDRRGNEISGGNLALRDAFFSAPGILQAENDLDPILRGLATQRHQELDNKIVHDLRNFLFGPPGSGGLDLASLNIQRGRDHGVRSYNDTREAVGLSRVSTFSEITSDLTVQRALFETYGSVDEIDLWVGGLSEDPLISEGSQMGPLFRAILVRQFTAVRDGDRFWHERNLTKFERKLVKGMTLSKVIRLNTGVGKELQSNVFFERRDRRRRW